MATHDRRPVVRAAEDRWQRLGELLQLRRGELGYRRRPAFTRERDINIRLVTDIENAYRPNTFLTPTLREIAQAYAVTYESLIAVLNGKEDELTPVPLSPPELPPAAPAGTLIREEGARPYFASIYDRVLRQADNGNPDPTGADLGLPPDLADVWDATRGAMSRGDRAWTVAEVQRREAARREAGNADATSA